MSAADQDTTVRREGVHVVHGALIRCCEQGETDCPCTCHPDPQLPADTRGLDHPASKGVTPAAT